MKRVLTAVLAAAILMTFMLLPVSAACQVAASASSSTPYVGDSVTFTFRFTGSAAVGSADTLFSFDTSRLQYKSYSSSLGNANVNASGGGTIQISDYSSSNTSATYTVTLTFTASAVGAATVKLTSSDIGDTNGDPLGTPTAEASVTVKAKPSPSLSSNCNLSALKVPQGCTLSPAFSSNVTQYTCTVPYSVTSFPIEPTRSDSKSSIEFIGKVSLDVGKNTRSVRVTAEDGTTKTYTITITRQAAESTEPTPVPPTEEPGTSPDGSLTVTVDGKSFILEEQISKELPAGFTAEEYTYSGRTIQTAVFGDVRLVLLSDETDSYFYILDEKNLTFSLFQTLTSGAQTVYTIFASAMQTVPSSWKTVMFEINGESFPAWQTDLLGEGYYIISAMNNTTGEKYLCVYCAEDGTVQKLSSALLEERLPQETQPPVIIQTGIDWRKAALAAAVVALAAVLAALVVLLVKRKKAQSLDSVRDWGLDETTGESENTENFFYQPLQQDSEENKNKEKTTEKYSSEDDSDFM